MSLLLWVAPPCKKALFASAFVCCHFRRIERPKSNCHDLLVKVGAQVSRSPRSGSVNPRSTMRAFAFTTLLSSSTALTVNTQQLFMSLFGGTPPRKCSTTFLAIHWSTSICFASFIAALCSGFNFAHETSAPFRTDFDVNFDGFFRIFFDSCSFWGIGIVTPRTKSWAGSWHQPMNSLGSSWSVNAAEPGRRSTWLQSHLEHPRRADVSKASESDLQTNVQCPHQPSLLRVGQLWVALLSELEVSFHLHLTKVLVQS